MARHYWPTRQKKMRKETDNFLNRVRQALTLPIRTRCAELTVLFDRGNTTDLQNVFPLIIDSIFGPQGSISWGLRTFRSVNEDFRQLEHFLSPCGPLFKVIYALLKDPSSKYDFPVAYLPMKVQQVLDNVQAHPFYADLVHVNPQTRHVISLLLNPFDYYIFHFAYHLINPWHQRSGVTTSLGAASSCWNTVYYALCCDYLIHFLPTDPSMTVLPVVYYSGKSPVQPLQQASRSPAGSKLINISVLNKSVEEYALHQNFGRHPRNQIWRSETVLTVFTDMWLNNDQITLRNQQLNQSLNSSTVPRLLQFCELPSSEYLRIVRCLIKQLHAFSASAKLDDTHMCELKKVAIPMVQGKFYIFLRNLIHRWPLDGSFRLLLELWLTYLQPWRYPPDVSQRDLQKQNGEDDLNAASSPSVGREHMPFIAENLLAYVVIFQQLLPRFTRVDLVSPKMSIMLYRISKVFNQPNLATYLQEIEHSIDNNLSGTHSYSSHWSSNLPSLNPTSNWCTNTSFHNLSGWNNPSDSLFNSPRKPEPPNTTFMNSLFGDRKWSAIVKQRIYELEGPTFAYKQLFSVPPAPEVFELIIQIKKSIKVAQDLIQVIQAEEREQYSFLKMFKFFWEPPLINDEFSLTERLKVPAYLETSLENLLELFQINEIPETHEDTTQTSTSSGLEIGNDFRFLTPPKVRERMKSIKYDGDPDLHPIRSTEVAFLVRMFYQIALYINEKYRTPIRKLYYHQNYLGRFSRQFLEPPMTVYRYDKTTLRAFRVGINLPPRVSLRYFAQHNVLMFLITGAVIAVMFGFRIPTYVLFLVFICLLYKGVKAIAPIKHNYPTQGFGNISFNDSF